MGKLFEKFKEIFRLGSSLAKANFKLRNEGSFFGILWYLLEPLLMFLILLFIFSNKLGSGIDLYPLYLLLALVMFNFFAKTSSSAVTLITSNSGFIKSMKLNQESLVFSLVLQNIFSHFFEIVIFGVFLFIYTGNVFSLIFYPIILIFFSLFILGSSLILSTIGVYFRDLDNIWRVFIRALWFATPLFYSIKNPGLLFLLNPLYYFINISREIIIYHQIPSLLLFFGVIGISLLFFIVGIIIFEIKKKQFAELI